MDAYSSMSPLEVGLDLNRLARKTGHFVFTNWGHSADYVDNEFLLTSDSALDRYARAMAWETHREFPNVQAVGGPCRGGDAVARAMVPYLEQLLGCSIMYVPTKRVGSDFILDLSPEQLAQLAGKELVLIEDTTTTGGSLHRVAAVMLVAGAVLIGAMLILNRGQVTAEAAGVPKLCALLTMHLPTFSEQDCPLCKEDKVPVNETVGNGAAFMARKRAAARAGQ